ncbi:MAG: exosortase/archaeosortase family protein [Planctomycetota bacterium]
MTQVAAVFLPLLVAYAATGRWIWDRWLMPDSYYAHGPLVVGVGLAMLWWRRRTFGAVPGVPDPRGWWLLGPGLLLHLVGAALMIDSLSAASLVPTLFGAVWLAYGRARGRSLAPIVALTAFAIPMPIFMTGRLAFELKEIALTMALRACDLVGVAVRRVGAEVYVAPHDGALLVADPCSGLRSLIALVTLGYGVAFFTGPQHGARRWILLASALPVAVLSNVLRIAGICVVARSQGVEYAATTGHDILTGAAWILDLALLLLLDRWLTRGAAR